MSQLSTKSLTFNQQLQMGAKNAKQWLYRVNATGFHDGLVQEFEFQKLSANPPVYPPEEERYTEVKSMYIR